MVDGIAPAVPGQGQHVARGLFHLLQDFLGIVNEHILGIDVVARKQQPDRSGERKHAVTAVGGQTLITSVRSHACGQVLRIGKDMQAEVFITYPHPFGIEADVLQYGRSVFHFQGQVLFEQPGSVFRTDQLFRPQPFHPDMAGIVHDTFELLHGFEELTTASQSVISLGRMYPRHRVLKSLRRRVRSRVVLVRYRKQRCCR